MAKRKELTFYDKMMKIKQAGLEDSPSPNRLSFNDDELEPLENRVCNLFNIINKTNRTSNNMLFFVMYDIENNKVRTQIVKYLIKNGCVRIQKSIFLADLPKERFDTIKKDLTHVQSCYENNDSILVVPISTDYLQAMRVIGKQLQMDIITKSKNTLFF